jgi:hypothetical protein
VAALVGGALSVAPVRAQEAPQVPSAPNITDAAGDANHHSAVTGIGTGVSMTGADILAVWFTEDAENLYTHIQTATSARPESMTFIVYADPGKGAECLQLRTTTGGAFNDPFASVNLTADCGTAGTTQVGEVSEAEGPDETSILTSSYPKKDVPVLADGTTLTAPNALVGYNAQQVSPRAGIIDDTEVGTDYTIEGRDGPVEKPKKKKPKGKKACLKLKGKAKKKCLKKFKKKKVKKCAAYKPGELGADAPTIVVTDAATEEAPVEQTVEFAESVADVTFGLTEGEYSYFNVQVDSRAKAAGLNVLFESTTGVTTTWISSIRMGASAPGRERGIP